MICALRSTSDPAPRRALLATIGALYLLPSLLGILLQVVHGLEHSLTTPGSSGTEPGAGVVVHSHDGSTHSHGAAVAVLAAAAVEESDPEADPEAVPPLVLLALHAPGPELTIPPAATRSSAPEDSGIRARDETTPPLPPPRG